MVGAKRQEWVSMSEYMVVCGQLHLARHPA